jgi:hypothetical protein
MLSWSLALRTRKILIYRERRMELLSRRHKWRPRKRNDYGQTRRNHPALNKHKEALRVAKALPYRHVVITSKIGSVTRRTKWQLKFDTVMGPNTWQMKTGMAKACSAPVCFRKTMTAEVEFVAALVWNGATLFSSVWKVKFQFAICASSLEEEIKVLFSCCCYSYIHLYVYIKIHENAPCIIDKRKQTALHSFVLIILFK